MAYIRVPITVSPDEMFQRMVDSIRAVFPQWNPNEANLDVWIMRSWAAEGSEIAEMASDVPDDIFRYLGSSILALPPLQATNATVGSTWTMRDNAGYTIPADTIVGIRNTAGELIPFRVDADVIVPAGSTATAAGAVTLFAVDAGVAANGLGIAGTDAELIDVLDFVSVVDLTGTTNGGQDAEDNSAYLDRLAAYTRRLSTRPILPADFEALARDVVGVYRALALDGYKPDAGAFTGNTTSGSPTIAVVSTFANITVGSEISGAGISAGSKVLSVNTGAATLTMDRNATATATTVALTSTGTYNNERLLSVAVIDQGGNNLSAGIKTAVDDLMEVNREVNFDIRVIDPTRTAIAVTFAAKALPGYQLADVDTRSEAAVAAYLEDASWGADPLDPRSWRNITSVRYFNIAQIIEGVEGLDYLTSLTIGRQGGAMGTVDVPLDGAATLATAGTIAGTIT